MRINARIMCLLVLVSVGAACKVDFDAVEDSVREARRGLTTHEWREGSHSLKVSIKGKITLTEDESDVATLEADGFLNIDQRGDNRWTYEAVALPTGKLQRTFTRDGRSLTPGSETGQWLKEILPQGNLFSFRWLLHHAQSQVVDRALPLQNQMIEGGRVSALTGPNPFLFLCLDRILLRLRKPRSVQTLHHADPSFHSV